MIKTGRSGLDGLCVWPFDLQTVGSFIVCVRPSDGLNLIKRAARSGHVRAASANRHQQRGEAEENLVARALTRNAAAGAFSPFAGRCGARARENCESIPEKKKRKRHGRQSYHTLPARVRTGHPRAVGDSAEICGEKTLSR